MITGFAILPEAVFMGPRFRGDDTTLDEVVQCPA